MNLKQYKNFYVTDQAHELMGRKSVGYEIFETYHQLIQRRYMTNIR